MDITLAGKTALVTGAGSGIGRAIALALAPERHFIDVSGARIELLTWGERGRPGLLMLHGAGAHAHGWSHIAPFFAQEFRVAALSWSGMGASDWRETYSVELFGDEILAAAEAGGLFDSPQRPLVVGHSFGGVMLVPAMARFRFSPLQSCDQPYIADHIARHALKPVPMEGRDEPGWTWRFDPRLPNGMSLCPLAFVAGALSPLTGPVNEDYIRRTVPPGMPWIDIPEANHHVPADQTLALIAALRALFASWDRPCNAASSP